MRIVINPKDLRRAAQLLADGSQEYEAAAIDLRGLGYPAMPPEISTRIQSELTGIAARMDVLAHAVRYEAVMLQLRANLADALSKGPFRGRPGSKVPEWMTEEYLRKWGFGALLSSADVIRKRGVQGLEEVEKSFGTQLRSTERRLIDLQLLVAQRRYLALAMQREGVAGVRANLQALRIAQAKAGLKVAGLKFVGRGLTGYFLVMSYKGSAARTPEGKAVSTVLATWLTKTPQGALIDVGTLGTVGGSADSFALLIEAVATRNRHGSLEEIAKANRSGTHGPVLQGSDFVGQQYAGVITSITSHSSAPLDDLVNANRNGENGAVFQQLTQVGDAWNDNTGDWHMFKPNEQGDVHFNPKVWEWRPWASK